MSDHAHAPYYKVLGWLTALTILEIAWAVWFKEAMALLIVGLFVMALAKAALVFLYYMHMKYEGKVLWFVMSFPIVLVGVMVAGFLPDSFKYWD